MLSNFSNDTLMADVNERGILILAQTDTAGSTTARTMGISECSSVLSIVAQRRALLPSATRVQSTYQHDIL
jgi:hypothetical protein